MATTRIWQSINETWNAANFGGTLPADDEIAVIPRWASIMPSVGMNQTGVLLEELIIEPGCPVGLGGPSNPLIIGARKFRDFGSGNVYHSNDAGLTTKTYIDKPGGMFIGSGNASLLCVVRRGEVRLSRAHTWVQSLVAPGNRAHVRIEPGTSSSEIVMDGGTIENYAASAAVTIKAGTLLQLVGAITRLEMAGGLCHYDVTSTLDYAEIDASARLDLTRIPMARTITTLEAASRKNVIADGQTTFTTATYWDEEAAEAA